MAEKQGHLDKSVARQHHRIEILLFIRLQRHLKIKSFKRKPINVPAVKIDIIGIFGWDYFRRFLHYEDLFLDCLFHKDSRSVHKFSKRIKHFGFIGLLRYFLHHGIILILRKNRRLGQREPQCIINGKCLNENSRKARIF